MTHNFLKQERRNLVSLVLILIGICLIIPAAGRMIEGNHFEIHTPRNQWQRPETPEMHIEWEQGEMNVERFELQDDGRMRMTFAPDDPGVFEFGVKDPDGSYMYWDRLYVDRFGTVRSELTGNFTGDNGVVLAFAVLLTGLAFLFLRQFIRLRGALMYSYDALLYCGAGIFCTVAGLNLLNLFVQRLLEPDRYWMRSVYETLSLSPGVFMMITSPLLLIFSLLMIISNIELLRHERFRIHNVLGLGIGLGLIICEVFGVWLLQRDFVGSERSLRVFYAIGSVYATIFAYFECILMSSVICGIRAVRHVPDPDKDYILILGCGFRKDGTLPPLLRGRVDKAIEFWQKQKDQTGREAVLIPSGGQGGDEPMAEAEAMARYIRERGIPDRAVMKEDESRNTYQNMEFSMKKIAQREAEKEGVGRTITEGAINGQGERITEAGPGKGPREEGRNNVIFVTTNYHVFRSGVWSGLAGLYAEGLGSRTKWWFWPNAFIRECIGLLVNRMRQEILLLAALAVFFGFIAMQIV